MEIVGSICVRLKEVFECVCRFKTPPCVVGGEILECVVCV